MVVVGLGNPGPDYAHSRHNLGFAVVNGLITRWTKKAGWKQASDYVYIQGKQGGRTFLLMKPTTFMNLSGNAIRKAGRKFDINPGNLVVIHDDLDVAYGKAKLKFGGSPAGHKGVISIAGRLGTLDFHRLKIGIGLEGLKDTVNYVLEQMNDDEWGEFEPAIDLACRGMDIFLNRGSTEAVQYINTHGKSLGESPVTGQGEDGR